MTGWVVHRGRAAAGNVELCVIYRSRNRHRRCATAFNRVAGAGVIGHGDGQRLLVAQTGGIGDLDGDQVAVVVVRIGGGFKVGDGLEGQHTRGADIELACIRTKKAVSLGVPAVGIRDREIGDRTRAVFCVTNASCVTAAVAGDDRGGVDRQGGGSAGLL